MMDYIYSSYMKNHKATRILAFLVVLAVFFTACKPQESKDSEEFDPEQAYQLVERQLAFGPRIPGSNAIRETRAWIEGELIDYGWKAESQCFEHEGIPLCNILAWPSEHSASKPYVLLSAHYDTRRFADSDPISPGDPVPGANDGASGVAVLLELARVLEPGKLSFDIELAFFDGEDQGRLDGWDWSVGASYMAANLKHNPDAVVVVDMVGDRDLQIYIENNSDRKLAEEIWSIAAKYGFSGFIPESKHSIIDDHLPFVQLSIPAVDVIDIEYAAWHTTADTVDQISAESLYQVGRTLQLWLEER
jgi:glutaminyl-peptide cyclotransferase